MAMNRPSSRIICDAGLIIHLDELDCLDLLNDFEEVILPSTVEAEVMEHRASAIKSLSLVVKRQEGIIIGEKLQAL